VCSRSLGSCRVSEIDHEVHSQSASHENLGRSQPLVVRRAEREILAENGALVEKVEHLEIASQLARPCQPEGTGHPEVDLRIPGLVLSTAWNQLCRDRGVARARGGARRE